MKKRGIVVLPSFSIVENDRIVYSIEGLSAQYLRKCVLFWDVIDCPEDIIGGSSVGNLENDVRLLQDEGIFYRTRGHLIKRENDNYKLTFSAEHPHEFWTLAQLYTWLKHQNSDTYWSIGQQEQKLVMPTFDSSNFIFVEPGSSEINKFGQALVAPRSNPLLELHVSPSIEIELFNALPTPSAEVKMEQLLKFKNNRKDDLERFRYALDELYLSIVNSNDQKRAISHAVDKLD
jgi:hypothetical protein